MVIIYTWRRKSNLSYN